jgi:hypothetical protein
MYIFSPQSVLLKKTRLNVVYFMVLECSLHLQVLSCSSLETCTKMTAFSDVTPCSLVELDQCITHRPDGGSIHLWNIGLLHDYTELCCRKLLSSYSLLWEPEISRWNIQFLEKKIKCFFCYVEIWGFHDDENVDCGQFCSDSVWSCRLLQVLQGNILPPSSVFFLQDYMVWHYRR